LHDVFGFTEFRPLQEEAVRAALDNRDVLVVMPTGAGKSLCFQLPALLTEGVTLVVSPLVALMRDQVEGLLERTGYYEHGCAYLNSLQTSGEQSDILRSLRGGHLKLVYVAPERFRSQGFLDALRSIPIARFVVDEAHCISEWGHDFRPDYLSIRTVVEELSTPGRRIPLMAVTATATQRVQTSIVANLGMHEPAIFIGGFNRPNLHYAVHRCKNDNERNDKLARALPKMAQRGGSGLIYVATRNQCEEVAALASRALSPIGLRAAPYHAGMDASLRNTLQSQWLSGQLHTLVATNAFGMGIDKPDVRFVVHYVFPENLESYYQEAGRAGRDGRKSRCVILYHFSDKRLREWFIENDALDLEAVTQAHKEIQKRARGFEPGAAITIPRGAWSTSFGWTDVKSRLIMSELERAGVIQRLGETGDETIMNLLRNDLPREAVKRITVDLQRQRDERTARLEEMVSYCKTTQCRRTTVLNYFGDGQLPETNGFCCDNCERPAAAPAVPVSLPDRNDRVPMPPQVDGANIHSLLQGLDALWPQVGKARLNKILRGAASKDVERFRADGCPLLGAARGASESQVDGFLTALIERGLLHQADEDQYFVCTITRAGREAWQTGAAVDVVPPNARVRRESTTSGTTTTKAAVTDLDEAESELFETLRDWRRREASIVNLPSYCILPDKTLRELAVHQPQDKQQLSGINGIGTSKLEKFGDAILQLLKGEQPEPVLRPVAVESLSQVDPHPLTPGPSPLSAAATDLTGDVVDTHAMLEDGFLIDEIAEERSLPVETVWQHLEVLIAGGHIGKEVLDALITTEVRMRVENVLDRLPVGIPVQPVWEELDGQVEHGPIRCVIAHRARPVGDG